LPDWLPVLEERFCRIGALALQPLASAGGPAGRQARQRAITLLLRLGGLHQPCPPWVLQAARSLLQSDCDDGQSLPEISRERTQMLRHWRQQLGELGGLDGELESGFERALAAAAGRLAVSVVIPFRGRSEELAPALAALEAQTLADFEVVVVADGCALDEAALAGLRGLGLAARVVRLDENRGTFWARAAGAATARGHYLWFLDHDDSVGPRFLERMLGRARATAADVVECPLWVVPAGKPPHSFQRFAGACVREGAAILRSYLTGSSHNNLANKLIRRGLWQAAMEQLEAMGLQAHDRLTCFEDMLCTVVLYQLAERYASTIEIDYAYLQREASTTHNRDPAVVEANLASMETVLRLLRPLLLDHGDADALAAFQGREVDWSLEHLLLGRVQRSLTPAGWERVDRIQRMLGLELSGAGR
jgi:glycosyltransferase involved in cell wall biosynthesis